MNNRALKIGALILAGALLLVGLAFAIKWIGENAEAIMYGLILGLIVVIMLLSVIKYIRRQLIGIVSPIDTPSKKIAPSHLGKSFEDYVRENLFPKSHYELLHRTPDFAVDDYDASSVKPDFEFCHRNKKRQPFYVEAKFRTNKSYSGIEWCNDGQIERYLSYNKKLPLFVALGVGAEPSDPQEIYLFPVKKIPYQKAYISKLNQFRLSTSNLPVKFDRMWDMLK